MTSLFVLFIHVFLYPLAQAINAHLLAIGAKEPESNPIQALQKESEIRWRKMIFYITPRAVMIIESCRILLVLCLVFFSKGMLCAATWWSDKGTGGWTIWPGELSPGNWYLMSKHGELSQTQGYNPRNSGFPNHDFPFLRRHFQGETVTLSSNSGCGFTDPWCSWHC